MDINILHRMMVFIISRRPNTTRTAFNLVLDCIYYIVDSVTLVYAKVYDRLIIPDYYPTLSANINYAIKYRQMVQLHLSGQKFYDDEGFEYRISDTFNINEECLLDTPEPPFIAEIEPLYIHQTGAFYPPPSMILENWELND